MLALKLVVVPAFLALLSLAARRWGPGFAGWLAGLPVVAGPILVFIALERGAPFASDAASASLAALGATVSFCIAYARIARAAGWPRALAGALATWLAIASVLSVLPSSLALSLAIALAALAAAPRLIPAVGGPVRGRRLAHGEVALRMAAGAALTVAVTTIAAAVGARWSGLLAVFPVLSLVLTVFTHRAQGADAVTALLRGMATGMYSFIGFCGVLSLALPGAGIAGGFALALAASLGIQALTLRRHAGR